MIKRSLISHTVTSMLVAAASMAACGGETFEVTPDADVDDNSPAGSTGTTNSGTTASVGTSGTSNAGSGGAPSVSAAGGSGSGGADGGASPEGGAGPDGGAGPEGGAGGASSTGASGGGGEGGEGTPPPVCAVGTSLSCYSGPVGTEGVGACTAGTQSCLADGSGWGPCLGQQIPAAEDCSNAADDDCSGLACAQPLVVRTMGASGGQTATSVAVDGSGNMIVVGAFSGAIDLGGGLLVSDGDDDVFVAKYDATGQHVWSKRFGGGSDAAPTAVAVDGAGDIAVVGTYAGTLSFGGGVFTATGHQSFVVKLDASGAHLWSRAMGVAGLATENSANAVAMDGAGNVIVAIRLNGCLAPKFIPSYSCLASTLGDDGYVAKYDAAGNALWGKTLTGADSQVPTGVAVDSVGDVIVTGSFKGSLAASGTTLTATQTDAFVARYDAIGNLLWAHRYGGPGTDTASAVALDAAGNVVMAGTFDATINLGGPTHTSAGSSDVFIAKLTGGGGFLWSKRFGGQGLDVPRAITIGASGIVGLVGSFATSIDLGGGPMPADGDVDAFVAELDADGAHLWSRRFGDAAGQLAKGARFAPSGNLAVVGSATGTIDLGTGPSGSGSATDEDAFLAVFAP